MTCGIYRITNNLTDESYIGASKNIEQRWGNYKWSKKERLYHIIKNYGIENFTFEIIEECPIDQFYDKEREYIKLYNTEIPNGYNLTPGGEHNFNTTGIYRVYKTLNNDVKSGYSYAYKFIQHGNATEITSVDLRILKKKVESQNLPWKILDYSLANETFKNNERLCNEMEYNKDSTGFYRVSKINSSTTKANNKGHYYKYKYKENNQYKSLVSKNIRKLKENVLKRNLPWKMINKDKANNTLIESDEANKNYNHMNLTGFYKVSIMKTPHTKQGFVYRYRYSLNGKNNSIISINIKLLEQKVKAKNLPWKIIDEKLAEKTRLLSPNSKKIDNG